MKINSRQKGARREREAAKYLESLGFKVSRMGRNGYSAADLNTDDPVLDRWHIEVKGVEAMHDGSQLLEDAFWQAERDCPAGKTPAVMLKLSRRPWVLYHFFDDVWQKVWGDTRIRWALTRVKP